MCKNKNLNLATKAKGLILKISKVFSGQTLLSIQNCYQNKFSWRLNTKIYSL